MAFVPNLPTPGNKFKNTKPAMTPLTEVQPQFANVKGGNKAKIAQGNRDTNPTSQNKRSGYRVGGRSKTKRSNNNDKPVLPIPFYGGGDGVDMSNTFIQVNGFNVLNESGQKCELNIPKDDSLYKDPIHDQGRPVPAATVDNQTQFTIYRPLFTFSDDPAWLDNVLSTWVQEVNANTNGGNAVTKDLMTGDKIYDHTQTLYQSLNYLVDLMTLQAWAAEGAQTNLVMRKIARILTSSSILEARNTLAESLSAFILPTNLYDFVFWFNQVYKTNPKEDAVNVKMINIELFDSLISEDPSTSIYSDINSWVSKIRQYCDFKYTALLSKNVASTNWSWLRDLKHPSNVAHYDTNFLDIYNNVSFHGSGIQTPSKVNSKTPLPSCFMNEPENVSILAMDSVRSKISSEEPAFFRVDIDTLDSGGASGNVFIMYLDDNSTNGISALICNSVETGISDRFIKFGNGTNDWVQVISGDNSQLFYVSGKNIEIAQYKLIPFLLS